MAGIGFQLRTLLSRDSYAGLLGAYGYAGVASSGPWVVSIGGVLAIGLLATGSVEPPIRVTQFLVSITWLMSASLLLTGPLQLLFARFVADQIYARKSERILPNLFAALSITTFAGGALASAVVHTAFDESLACRLLLVANFVVLCDGWLLLVLLSGVKAYRTVAALFLAAYLASIGGAAVLRPFGLEGLLAGFLIGQAGALFGMLALILRAFPGERRLSFDFLDPRQAHYELAAIGAVFYFGVWADKAAFWLNPGTSEPVFGPLRYSIIYDLPIFFAYLSAIPAMAAFFLRLEADFADRCQEFFRCVRDGAPLDRLTRVKDGMVGCVRRGLAEIVKVQGVTMVLVFVAGPAMLRAAGISPLYLRLLYVDTAAVFLQVVFLAVLNVLFYLDQRKAALALSALFACGNLVLTLLTQRLGPTWYGYGFAASALIASATGLPLLSRKLDHLERDTFMQQPLWPPARPAPWGKRFRSLVQRRSPVVNTPRALIAIAVVSVVFACGRGSDPRATSATSSVAGRQLGLDPLPPPPIGPICEGPACVGDHVESITLGPVAPPVIPSSPLGPTPPPPLPVPLPSICPITRLGMQVLVISATGNEPSLQAIQQALGYHTVPFTTWVATQNLGQLTPDKLSSGCDSKYQGVILATGDLVYSPDGGVTWASALSAPEWLALRSYEASFKVREISWYVYPGTDQGLNPPSGGVDTNTTPIQAHLTAAGQNVFTYVNNSNPLPISLAWTYLTTPSDPAVTPLLVDDAGHALISTRVNTDGRETMALTFDSNPYLIHDLVLAHGLVEWVTKGLYLGEFRAYTAAQNDDILIDDDMYQASMYPGGVYRMTPDDLDATRAWQVNAKVTTANPDFRIAYAFNGAGGSDPDNPDDPLTLAVTANSGDFQWINHTFDHENLDNVDYAFAYAQFDQNIKFAQAHNFKNFSVVNVVTPDVSGLKNPAAMQAAWDVGIRYTITDTSQPGWDNPSPNIGIYSTLVPGLFHIPRKPTNLYYNVSTPDDWTAEYNSFYTSYWGRALSYSEVLDKESANLLLYLLQGNIDPTMYHQPNTRAYDGTRTLLGDLLDTAFGKFRAYSTLPIISPDEDVIGKRMQNTMARNSSGLTATITPGVGVSFTSPVSVEFAVSGICTATSERYGGKCITNVKVEAGQTVTFVTL